MPKGRGGNWDVNVADLVALSAAAGKPRIISRGRYPSSLLVICLKYGTASNHLSFLTSSLPNSSSFSSQLSTHIKN